MINSHSDEVTSCIHSSKEESHKLRKNIFFLNDIH
jgi:hypothetical protein